MNNKKVPMRKCAGCGAVKPKKELLRITMGENGLHPDPTGRANGRGVYLCIGSRECFELAKKKRALARALHAEVSAEDMAHLAEEFAEYER